MAPALLCMQAALQEAHDQNNRLTLTVSAMRSDMELMQHHATSPGPHSNPSQNPPASSPPRLSPAYDQSASFYQTVPVRHHQQHHGPNASDEDRHGSQPSLHVEQQQQQKQKQEEEVQLLRQQLQDAKAEAEALAEENERLMDMSNALRSECERSATRQQQPVMPVTSSGAQGSVQQPYIGMPLAPEVQPQQVYYQAHQAYPLGPQTMPPGQPLHPYAVQWATQGMPHPGFSEHPPQVQQALISAQGDPGQAWDSVQQPQQPAGQLAPPSGHYRNSLALTMPDDGLPPEVSATLKLNALCAANTLPDLRVLKLLQVCCRYVPAYRWSANKAPATDT